MEQNGTREGMAKAAVAKVVTNREQRGHILADDQGSCQGHQCSKTALQENLVPL